MAPKLIKLGIAIASLGMVTLIYSFFTMYGLVSNCPNGTDICQAYSNWHLVNKIGIALLVLGLVMLVVSWLHRPKNLQ